MPIESATYLNQLVATNPLGSDAAATGDNHLRLVKAVLLATWPNINAAVTVTPTELNRLLGITGNVQAQIDAIISGGLSAVLPGQSGKNGRFIRTDGTNATWEWPDLAPLLHTVSGAAVAGRKNIIVTPGITLTIPASPAANDPFEIVNASNAKTPMVDWGTHKLHGRSDLPGLMTLDGLDVVIRVTYIDATRGFC